MMKISPLAIASAAMLWACPCQAAAQDKAPAPDAAAQKQAEKLIREVFKEEYARTSAADKPLLDFGLKVDRGAVTFVSVRTRKKV